MKSPRTGDATTERRPRFPGPGTLLLEAGRFRHGAASWALPENLMKKSIKKIVLAKETLRNLTGFEAT